MKHLLLLIICGVALLLYPVHSRAEPYTLSYSLVDPCHKTPKGSRAPKRPLVVDLVGAHVGRSEPTGWLHAYARKRGW